MYNVPHYRSEQVKMITIESCCKTIAMRYVSTVLLLIAALYAQPPGAEVKIHLVLQQPGGKAGMQQLELSKLAKAGPGRELRVLVLTNRDCVVSFAGFTRDGH